MTRKLIFFIISCLCSQFLFAQKPVNSRKQYAIYKAASGHVLKTADTDKYLLIQLKDPRSADLKKLNPLKRISYNTYIIKSTSSAAAGANTAISFPANSLWKATDNLLQVWQKHQQSSRTLKIKLVLDNDTSARLFEKYGAVKAEGAKVILLTTLYKYLPEILGEHPVIFANMMRKAHEETPIPDIDLAAANITAVRDNYPDIDGTGINLAIKENLYDETDLDIAGRAFKSFVASSIVSQHATDMATLIGGGGNSYIKGTGAAPMVKFTSSTFDNLSADTTAIFKSNNISIQNHSYGTGIENVYSDESLSYDQQVNDDDTLVHIFSSGNIGTTGPTSGLYNGITGYANISGAFKQAKNILVIGGTGRNNVASALSSAGPAYDGRVIPQLVTDGEDGTSGSAALVSGAVALMQQDYKKIYGQLPSAALVKSILINSADDIGNAAVDFKTGYGKLNALEAIRTVNDGRFDKGTVASGDQIDIPYTVSAGSSELKISLAWDDLPAQLNVAKALVNDLDLSVSTPSGAVLLPWTLSTFPSADSLGRIAVRKKDNLNTAEHVTLQSPAAGTYIIHIKGSDIPQGSQIFYVAKQVVAANKFEWIYPAGNDQLFAADSSYLRWQNSYAAATGQLSVSYDHGTTWQAISNVALKNKYYAWQPPDVFTTALLKMDIGGVAQISKEFSISKPLNPQVGYNCTSGTLLHWAAQTGATGYVIYNIKDNLLQKLTTVSDTSVIVNATQQSSAYFAVSAQGTGFEGIKSFTFNASQQGVGCYVKTLLATVTGNTIALNLDLGSVVNLTSITWEKLTAPGQYTVLGTTAITSSLNYQFTDNNPKQGIQYYRAKLITTDGTVIYSDQASAVYLLANQFEVFPNPVTTQINVVSGDLKDYDFKLYNIVGKQVLDKALDDINTVIPVKLAAGTYIYVISLNGNVLMKGKLVSL